MKIQALVRGRQHRRRVAAVLRMRDTRRLVNDRALAEGDFLRAFCGTDRMNQRAARKAFSLVGLDMSTLNFSTRCVVLACVCMRVCRPGGDGEMCPNVGDATQSAFGRSPSGLARVQDEDERPLAHVLPARF